MPRLTIRLPENEYNRVKEDAERNCRTISEELTYMIRLHKGPTNSTSNSTNLMRKTII